MKINVETQEKNGKIAVLVSHGYGAGWSTWKCKDLAYDKRVVEIFDKYPPKQNNEQLKEIQRKLKEIGYENVYMGGYNQIKKHWIARGVPFRIDEYDGSESIETLDDLDLMF